MNVFFTSYDGQVWINKSFMRKAIDETMKGLPNKDQLKHFANLLKGTLDSCVYKEPTIDDPNIDYFHCGSCRRDFPVKYKKDSIITDWNPCPICGSQSIRKEN